MIIFFNSKAQNIDVPSLFKPGVRLGGLYMPDISINDSVRYGTTTFRTTVIIPLNCNVNFNLQELNVSAHQSFLTINTGMSKTNFSMINTSNNIFNCSLSFLHIRASLSNGLWIYYVSTGLENNLKNNKNNFFTGIAGTAKVYIKGLNKINVFGLGIVYSKRVLPIPVIGLRRKVSDKTFFTAILPLEMDLSHKFSKKFELQLTSAATSLTSGFIVDTMNEHLPKYQNNNLMLSNINIQTSLLVIFKASKNLQIYAEGGIYPFLRLNLTISNKQTSIVKYDYNFAPFVDVTLRYNIGKFIFGSQLFGSDE